MHCLWIKPTSFKSQRAEPEKPGIYTQAIQNLLTLILTYTEKSRSTKVSKINASVDRLLKYTSLEKLWITCGKQA